MPKRETFESRLVQWASTAPLGTMQVVLGIVNGIAKQRAKEGQPTAATKQSKKAKTNAVADAGVPMDVQEVRQ